MSYLFDAATEALKGTLTAQRGATDITIAMWVKAQDWDGAGQYYIQLSDDLNDRSPSIGMHNSSTVDNVQGVARSAADAGSWCTEGVVADSANGVWWLVLVTVAASGISRFVYETDSTQASTEDTTPIAHGTALDEIMIGNGNTGAKGWSATNTCKIAEVCFWDKILSAAEINNLRSWSETGPAPNTIAPDNVFAYYPLDTDGDLYNRGSDAGGNLVATGAVYDADHPTITVPSVARPSVAIIRTLAPFRELRSHGYTVDFRKLRQTWQGAANVYTDHGPVSTLDSHIFNALNGYLYVQNDSDPVPSFQLNSSKFTFGAWQFCEALITIPVSAPITQAWIGPGVFMGGDTADSQVSNENWIGILCTTAGDGGSASYNLDQHDAGGYTVLGSGTGPDPAEHPVLLRIEARDLGTVTEIDWWIAGVKQTQILDSTADRMQHTTVSTTSTGRTSPGLVFGNNGGNDAFRRTLWFRGGNMPELPDPNRTILIGKPKEQRVVMF